MYSETPLLPGRHKTTPQRTQHPTHIAHFILQLSRTSGVQSYSHQHHDVGSTSVRLSSVAAASASLQDAGPTVQHRHVTN